MCLRASPRLAGIAVLLAMLFSMWFVYLTDLLMLGCNGMGTPGTEFCGYRYYFSTAPQMGSYGSLRSLVLGVPFQWLCHSTFGHIWSNTVFFFIFGLVIVLRSAVGDPVRTLVGAVACSALTPGSHHGSVCSPPVAAPRASSSACLDTASPSVSSG